jgi:selenide, water dikinase
LGHVIGLLPPTIDENLLVGTDTVDDAAVYRLTDELALVQTVDFFTPIVDDPYDFGRIAAANSLSDVYAMGARPLIALNIVGFPVNVLPLSYLVDILRGGADVAREAGVSIVGGHTIDDSEPKYGMAVTGTLRPGAQLTNAAARPGDLLVLTKPLGTGVIATAIKRGKADEAVVREAVESMVHLNRAASEAALAHGVRSMTDVTGFGLLGHLSEMCAGSAVSAEIWLDDLPWLRGARELARTGVVPGGTRRNLEYADPVTRWQGEFEEWEKLLVADAQTSGGLLIAVPDSESESLLQDLARRRTPAAALVGRILPPGAARVVVMRSREARG